MTAYQQLETRFGRIGAVDEAISVLHWDTAAVMPRGGAAARAEQLATLRLIAHEHLTAPALGELLTEAEQQADGLSAWQRANLREMRRRRLHAAAVPGPLVEAESRACSECLLSAGMQNTLPPIHVVPARSGCAAGAGRGATPYCICGA